jgi:signal transduction histidine kinase
MESREQHRYEILRSLVLGGVNRARLADTGQAALEQAAVLIGLDAAALYLWRADRKVELQLAYSQSDDLAAKLNDLEADLFDNLRRERSLVSAYMTFAGDPPCHSFTLPLNQGDKVFGAVIGLQLGERTTLSEEGFLDALAATIALNAIASGQAGVLPRELIDKERLAAVTETAVTVNDRINNPLTAIIGNVQLLLMNRDDLDDELRRKLTVIEESASRIKDVTQRLLRLTEARSTEYVSGTSMIDLSDPDESSSPDDKDPR